MTRVVPRRKNAVRVNAMAIAELLLGIQHACHTLYELAEMSGLSYHTVMKYCNVMHKRHVIHICDWEADNRGGRTLRVYAMGAAPDVPKPAPMTSKEACARYRARKKQEQLIKRMAG